MPASRILAPVALLAALLVACALILSACGASVSTGGDHSVSPKDAQAQIEKQLGPKLPLKIKTVSCPKTLAGKVGAIERCTLTYENGIAVEVRVKVTSVSDEKVRFNMLVTKRLS
jgi:hypothetical protein